MNTDKFGLSIWTEWQMEAYRIGSYSINQNDARLKKTLGNMERVCEVGGALIVCTIKRSSGECVNRSRGQTALTPSCPCLVGGCKGSALDLYPGEGSSFGSDILSFLKLSLVFSFFLANTWIEHPDLAHPPPSKSLSTPSHFIVLTWYLTTLSFQFCSTLYSYCDWNSAIA
jgi:hypothetical protein